MPLLLYINGQQADLEPGQVIARTLQVNDLNSLDNRQASYTNKFKVPKTANNTRILQFLTLPGNTSAVPYQKNECSLYSDNGECFVYKGRAVVTDGGDSYDVVVYDGIIDLYKAIENKMLASVGLAELDHEKSLANVAASWVLANNLPYRYILADYNGDTGNTAGTPMMVNIDYLVPSVNVAWLWDKIFASHGMGYTGAVFGTQNFTNLWMTYPKGINTTNEGVEIFAAAEFTPANPFTNYFDQHWRTLLVKYQEPDPFDEASLHFDNGMYKLRVKETGYYKISVSGTINSRENVQLFLGRNVTYTTNSALNAVVPFRMLSADIEPGESFEFETPGMELAAGDSICLMMRHKGFDTNKSIRFDDDEKWSMELGMKKLSLSDISFTDAFADFSIRDFLSEIVHRFGLTIHKDKYTDSYEFRTLGEQLQTAAVADWSAKFSKKISENYIYGSYARRNWFRYNYNDKESSHNDGYIDVPNVNLPDSRDLIKSKIYSPEKQKSLYMGRSCNVYRLWDKEVGEDQETGESIVTYKALDKRYYFLRAEQRSQSFTLYSGAVEESQPVTATWAENFWKLPFADILQEYYLPLRQVLDRAAIVTAELWLKDTDIVNFDFRKLYYLEQLSAYFIMNKIINYIPGKVTKCELIRVQYDPNPVVVPPIKITKVTVNNHDVVIWFDLDIPATTVTLQISDDGQLTWDNWPLGAYANPRHYNSTPTGTFHIRMQAGGEISNALQITIPSVQTILVP